MLLMIYTCMLDIYACSDNVRNRISPDEKAPIGAYASGITLFAKKNDGYICTYLHVYI